MTETNYKIIIVDDDVFLVDMYSAKFNHVGIAVDVCKNGEALLEKLRAGDQANLVLLDIVMPNLNGIEVLRQIRKEKLAANIPIVMLTNQNDEKDISEAKSLGISGYIVKSAATPSEVVTEVMNIIKSSNTS